MRADIAVCERAEQAVGSGYNIIVLSDRQIGPDRVAIPALLAYNAFVRSNRITNNQFDTFAHDLHDFFATGSRVGEVAGKR